jgi:hypothetical protein
VGTVARAAAGALSSGRSCRGVTVVTTSDMHGCQGALLGPEAAWGATVGTVTRAELPGRPDYRPTRLRPPPCCTYVAGPAERDGTARDDTGRGGIPTPKYSGRLRSKGAILLEVSHRPARVQFPPPPLSFCRELR